MSRIDKLKVLIDSRFGGNKAAFARAIERDPSQVSQWISGYRDLGDAGARIIEIALDLKQGYFDDGYRLEQSVPEKYTANVTQMPVQDDPEITQVIAMMRATDSKWKSMALAAVKVALHDYKPTKESLAS